MGGLLSFFPHQPPQRRRIHAGGEHAARRLSAAAAPPLPVFMIFDATADLRAVFDGTP
jgi:hypothetical protein